MNFVIESTPNKIEIDYDLISQIENKLEDNIPLSQDEAKYFLDYIVFITRTKFTNDLDNYSFEWKCDTAISIIGNYLNSLNVNYNVCDTQKVITNNIKGHTFMIVNLNTENGTLSYLIDPTYRQFFTKDTCNESNYTLINGIYVTTPNPGYFIKEEDKSIIKTFLQKGYSILDNNIARIYGDSFYNTKVGRYDKTYNSINGNIYLNSFLKGNSPLSKTEYELQDLSLHKQNIKTL